MSLTAQQILRARLEWGATQAKRGIHYGERQLRLVNLVTELLCLKAQANEPAHPEPECPCDGASVLLDAAQG